MISKTGIGAFGQFAKSELRRFGVLTDYLVMDHRVHTSIVFVARTTGTPDFEALRAGDAQLQPVEVSEEAIHRARIVHASTFALSREPCRSAVRKAFTVARDKGKVISMDPNYSPLIWPDQQEASRSSPNSMHSPISPSHHWMMLGDFLVIAYHHLNTCPIS